MSSSFITNPKSADPGNYNTGQTKKYLHTNKENSLRLNLAGPIVINYYNPYIIDPSDSKAYPTLKAEALARGAVIFKNNATSAVSILAFPANDAIKILQSERYIPNFIDLTPTIPVNFDNSGFVSWNVLFINTTAVAINLTTTFPAQWVSETGSVSIVANSTREIRFMIFKLDGVGTNSVIKYRPVDI